MSQTIEVSPLLLPLQPPVSPAGRLCWMPTPNPSIHHLNALPTAYRAYVRVSQQPQLLSSMHVLAAVHGRPAGAWIARALILRRTVP